MFQFPTDTAPVSLEVIPTVSVLYRVSTYKHCFICNLSLKPHPLPQRLFNGVANYTTYTKDAFHRYVIDAQKEAVNPKKRGSKMAAYYLLVVPSGKERTLRCRLMAENQFVKEAFAERNFGAVMQQRLKEADEFYSVAIPGMRHHNIVGGRLGRQ